MELSELVLHWYQGGDGSLVPEKAEAVNLLNRSFNRIMNSAPTDVSQQIDTWARATPFTGVFPPALKLIRHLDTNRVTPFMGTSLLAQNNIPVFSEFNSELNTFLQSRGIPIWSTPYVGPTALPYIRGQARTDMNNLFSNGIGFSKGSVVLGADFTAIAQANPNLYWVNIIKLRNYSGNSPTVSNYHQRCADYPSSHAFMPFYSTHEYWDPITKLFKPCLLLRLASTLQQDYIQSKSGLRVYLKNFLMQRLHRTTPVPAEFDRSQGWGNVYPQLEQVLRAAKPTVPRAVKPPEVTGLAPDAVKEIVLAGSLGTLPEKVQYEEVTKQLKAIDEQLINYSGTKRNTVAEIQRHARNITDYRASIMQFETAKATKEAELINLETNYSTFSDPNNLKRIRNSKEEALRAFNAAKQRFFETTDVGQANWIENLRIGSGVIIDDIYYDGVSAKTRPNTPKTMFDRIQFHTTAPSRITVLNTGKSQNPVVMGGPYYVELYLDTQGYGGIQVRPIDSNSIIGFHLAGTAVEYKFHPHTSPQSYSIANPQLRLDQLHSGCAGELNPILVEARNTDNPSLAVIGALGWLTTANGQDTYGRNWHWFPKPEEVKKWEKPDESPESLAAAASAAIVKARQEVEILSARDREVAAELERETTRNVEEFTPPFARAMQGVIPNYANTEIRNIVRGPVRGVAGTITNMMFDENALMGTVQTPADDIARLGTMHPEVQGFHTEAATPPPDVTIETIQQAATVIGRAGPAMVEIDAMAAQQGAARLRQATAYQAAYNPVTINIQGQE